MKYIYFISYSFKKGFDTGFGSSTYTMDQIIDEDNLKKVTEFVKEEQHFDNVAIMNFILLAEIGEKR